MTDTVLDLLQRWTVAELQAEGHAHFYYDKHAGAYYNYNGSKVPESVLLKMSNNLSQSIASNDIALHTSKLFNGQIELARWQQNMAQTLKDFHIVQLQIGKGGKANTNFSDYGKVGALLKKEYAALERFAADIAAGKLSNAQIVARAQLYANGVSRSYWIGKTSAMAEAGYDIERRILNPAEHCDDCIGYAALGWVPLGSLPEPGEASQCGNNCKCLKEYGKSELLQQVEQQELVPGEYGRLDPTNADKNQDASREAGRKFIQQRAGEYISPEDAKQAIVTKLSDMTGIAYENVNEFIRQWAWTSNDDKYAALEVQKVAARMFNAPLSEWQEGKLAEQMAKRSVPYSSATSTFEIDPGVLKYGFADEYADSEQIVEKLLRAMYDNTQAELAAEGIDKIVLYRGVTGFTEEELVLMRAAKESGEAVKLSANALESWSWSYDEAREFSSTYGGIVMRTEVPASRIVGSARTGFGCLSEGEFVILGNQPGDLVQLSWVSYPRY